MITRRDFLKRLLITATALSLDPLKGISVEGDLYNNNRLKLSVRKPKGWVFSSIADFAALRERQVIEGVLANEPHELRDPSNLPIFLFENPQYQDGAFLPAIALYDEPLRGKAPSDEVAAHMYMLNNFRKFYKNALILKEPVQIFLHGAKATIAEWSYLHEIEGGESHSLHIQSLLIFCEPRVHTYYLVDRSDAPCILKQEWRGFVDSIEYQS